MTKIFLLTITVLLASCGMQDNKIISQKISSTPLNVRSSPFQVINFKNTLSCRGNKLICARYQKVANQNAHSITGSYVSILNSLKQQTSAKVNLDIDVGIYVEDKDTAFGGLDMSASGKINFKDATTGELVYVQNIARNLPASEHKTNFWGLFGAVDWAVSDAIRNGLELASSRSRLEFLSQMELEKISGGSKNLSDTVSTKKVISGSVEEFEERCTRIGFKPGSGDHAKCVIELIK